MHHQGRTAVYRLYDRTDALIYVGITNNPASRWPMHAADKPWWDDVTLREVEWFETRREAENVEAQVISSVRPLWNIAPGLPEQVMPSAAKVGRGWKPPAALLALIRRYERAETNRAVARDELELALVAEMMQGVSANRLAKFLPWSDGMIRAIGKRGNVPALKESTVIGIRRYERIFGALPPGVTRN